MDHEQIAGELGTSLVPHVRKTESTVLVIIIGVVAVLLFISGAIVYTLSDRIVEKFSVQETLAEDKQAAMEAVKERALGEDRPKLTREEKMQFFSIVDLEGDVGALNDSESDGSDPTFTCDVSKRFASIGSTVTWSVADSRSDTKEYAYVWEGTDNLRGSAKSVAHVYTTTGVKTGVVTISEKGGTRSALRVECPVVRVQAADGW